MRTKLQDRLRTSRQSKSNQVALYQRRAHHHPYYMCRLKECGFLDEFFNLNEAQGRSVSGYYQTANDSDVQFGKMVGKKLEEFCKDKDYTPEQAIYYLLKQDANERERDMARRSQRTTFTRLYKQRISAKLRDKFVQLGALIYPKDPCTTDVTSFDDLEAEVGDELDEDVESQSEEDEEEHQLRTSNELEELSPQSSQRRATPLVAGRLSDWEDDSVLDMHDDDTRGTENDKYKPKCNIVDIMDECNSFDPSHDVVSLLYETPRQHLILWKCSHPVGLAFAKSVAHLQQNNRLPVHITCIVGFINLYSEIGLLVQCTGFEKVRTVTFLQPQMNDRYQTDFEMIIPIAALFLIHYVTIAGTAVLNA